MKKPSLLWLLVFAPVALYLRWTAAHSHPVALFFCAALVIIPLAGLMGDATEELAVDLGAGIGGLLNATFGNAAEMIIAIVALSKGLTEVVKASLTGSIIGNLLLVLGLSLFCGGLKYPRQTFNQVAASSTSTSLILASVALLIPTVFHKVGGHHLSFQHSSQQLSLAIAIILFGTYLASLWFSLKTHKQLFAGEEVAHTGPRWSKKRSVLTLLGATLGVAIFSEFLVGTLEETRAAWGMTEVFVGVIVVAVVGNAAEHSTAVMMALKNKVDLSLAVAVGSSLQIALFVAPILLFISYGLGQPFSLEFTVPEVVAVLVSVHLACQISGDGESNWLEGVQLLSLYAILAVLFFFLPA